MKTAQMLNSLSLKIRRLWGEDAYSPIDIFAIVNGWKEKKITIIKYPMSSRISGMCTKEKEDIVICINSTMSYGRQRFTLAHELYHVLFENVTRVICDMSLSSDKSISEKEADMFASYLLMPFDALSQYSDKIDDNWNLENIIDAEQFFQISHQAMLNRLVYDKHVDASQIEQYRGISIASVATKYGYGKELYFPSSENRKYFTTGEYIRKVEKMAENNLISEGKREEMLLDAYRADIVYDYDGEDIELND